MSGVLIIRELLFASAPVTALVAPTKIVIGSVAQGAVLPAISITHVSTVGLSAIDAQSAFNLVTSRVQITAMAKEYHATQVIIAAVRKACNYQRGTLGGVTVASVVRDIIGPDFTNEDATIHFQSIDFKITYHEPN